MKLASSLKLVAIGLAVCGTLLPQAVLADSPAPARKPVITDVALAGDGTLRGRVVDGRGVPKPGVPLSVSYEGQVIGKTTADKNGNFSFSRLKGGVHSVATTDGVFACRFWAPQTAPPSAKPLVMLVDASNVTQANFQEVAEEPAPTQVYNQAPPHRRYEGNYSGQNCYRGGRMFGMCFNNPILIGGILATAVGIPVAIHNSDNSKGSGS